MQTLSYLYEGFAVALSPVNLGYSFLGILIGNLIGVLPGIGPLTALSLLLPVTYTISPVGALMMLAGIYYGAQYGGATTAILLNVPGVPSHAVTCLDGNPMSRQGRAGTALFTAMYSSFIGACIGITIMILFSPLIVNAALKFGAAEYFSIMLLGLLAASTLVRGSPLKGIAMVAIGIILGLVGIDVNSGYQRFAFDIPELTEGINLIAIALGLFAISETMVNFNTMNSSSIKQDKVTAKSLRPEKGDIKRMSGAILRGASIGSFFGTLPGTGSTISAFLSYATEKKLSKSPEKFGTGIVEGIAAPEASNNAAAQTAFIPTMTLGIPGDPLMALMLSAMVIQGIQPGPQMLSDNPEVFWGLIASFAVGNLLLLVLNIPLIGLWIRLLSFPYRFIFPTIIFFVCVGVYSSTNNLFDVGFALFIGLAGTGLMRLGFEPAPLLLGFVLGPFLEENFRRAMLLSGGDVMELFYRPISGAILGICILMVGYGIFKAIRMRAFSH